MQADPDLISTFNFRPLATRFPVIFFLSAWTRTRLSLYQFSTFLHSNGSYIFRSIQIVGSCRNGFRLIWSEPASNGHEESLCHVKRSTRCDYERFNWPCLMAKNSQNSLMFPTRVVQVPFRLRWQIYFNESRYELEIHGPFIYAGICFTWIRFTRTGMVVSANENKIFEKRTL